MKKSSYKIFLIAFLSIFMFACGDEPLTTLLNNTSSAGDTGTLQPQAIVSDAPLSKSGEQILGNPDYQAISYGAFRAPTREEATVPSVADLKEDMLLLQAMDIKVLRTYNTQIFSDTANLLEAIDQLMAADPNFEMYVMLGVWVQAQGSYTANVDNTTGDAALNRAEMDKAIEMAQNYPEIIKVIAVGNEAMVDWQAHDIPVSVVLGYVNELQGLKADSTISADIWITSSDNQAVWSGSDPRVSGQLNDLNALIAAVDYISLHTYPFHDTHHIPDFWQVPADQAGLTDQQKIDAAMVRAQARVVEQYTAAQAYMLKLGINKPIHIGETGWATVGSPGGEDFTQSGSAAADEYKQKMAYDALRTWSNEFGASLFFFEAFDEQWKAGTENPATHPEKHFGLINMQGEAKYLLWDLVDAGAFNGLERDGLQITKTYGGNVAAMMDEVFVPPAAPVTNEPVAGEFIVLGISLYSNALAYGWDSPETAWAGVNDDTGVLTVATDPDTAATWGWGAGVGIPNETSNLSTSTQITFEIKGDAAFGFYLGFQTTKGAGTNHWVRFNTGSYTLTDQWAKYTISLSDFSDFASGNLEVVNSPFTIADIYETSGGSAPTLSTIEVKNISWLE
ncbi:conserved hypothetical protein [Psychromonas ingrahamii 37]|uniref:Endo-1,3-beta-glucanase btgC n=1 Tax=Psychromonas ingrahamii (strain DSM 17664 / CCUG 51855 / 37) TaxID=357804 RepID=A1SSE5_PSYIN|nr:glycosyl hydrolase family 17 protein [Psychromonas ingrahamii]ABM02410.1 conserved hypothetical protein [Psychromonas ingrahamii 37]